jgi:hypothetical protein
MMARTCCSLQGMIDAITAARLCSGFPRRANRFHSLTTLASFRALVLISRRAIPSASDMERRNLMGPIVALTIFVFTRCAAIS